MYDPTYIRNFYSVYGHREWARFEATPASYLALCSQDVLYPVMSNLERWAQFLEWEVAACREPGALDGGTQIIAVVQRATGLR